MTHKHLIDRRQGGRDAAEIKAAPQPIREKAGEQIVEYKLVLHHPKGQRAKDPIAELNKEEGRGVEQLRLYIAGQRHSGVNVRIELQKQLVDADAAPPHFAHRQRPTLNDRLEQKIHGQTGGAAVLAEFKTAVCEIAQRVE